MWTTLLWMLTATGCVSLNCPVAQCGTLPTNTCAAVQSNALVLSNCTSEFTCNLQDVMKIWPSTGATLPCAARPRTTFVLAEEHLTVIAARFCQIAASGRKLAGTHPKLCYSDTDCGLEGGGYGFCVCGLDGKSYCQYEKGDDTYIALKNAGCSENGADMLAAITKIHLYPLFATLPTCATGFFDDALAVQLMTMEGNTIEFEMINIVFGRSLVVVGVMLLLGVSA